MSRIIVDEYPSEAKDCPLAKYKLIEGAYGFYDRCKCKCSGELCCISDSIFDYDTIDGTIEAYTELVEEFLIAFSSNAMITLHIRQLSGSNAHHIIEGIFKSLARTMKSAVAIDGSLNGEIPSTKGVL